MYCSKCGTRLPENANYCISCGTRVEYTLQPNNMMEYYRSVIDFSYTKIEKDLHYPYLKFYDYTGCKLVNFDLIKVFPEVYEDIEVFMDEDTEYFNVKKEGKWALRTKKGLLTEFVFDSILMPFYMKDRIEGYTFVKINNKYGIIQIKTGKIVFDCTIDRYDHLGIRHHFWPKDYLWVSKKGQWGVISIKSGDVIKPFIYSEYDVYKNI